MEIEESLDFRMNMVKELVIKLRDSKKDSDEEEKIFIGLNSLLKLMIDPVMMSDKTIMTTPTIDGLSLYDVLVNDNKYEVVFIEDIVSWIIDGDHEHISDEKFQKILRYMVENNIRSYRQDW